MTKWRKLKRRQYGVMSNRILLWCGCLMVLLVGAIWVKNRAMQAGIIIVLCISLICIIVLYRLTRRIRNVSKKVEYFIERNNLYQSHCDVKKDLFGEKLIDVLDYYPQVEFAEDKNKNVFCIRFRVDGSEISQKLKNCEQSLADLFMTVCTDVFWERGYITYCFELHKQEQERIKSKKDIPLVGENEIMLSENVTWNWKQTPHLLLTGTTGSGKTKLAYYIIMCLLNQGVRIIYCDPKKDEEMSYLLKRMGVTYVTEVDEIVKVVREIEEEIRLRENDLQNIGLKEAEFNPVFLFFDELISFSRIVDKRTSEEVLKKFGSIVVSGRSKRVYAGAILQRSDSEFLGGGAIRDNFGCKICMGQMSEKAYEMTFGSEFSNIKNHRREMGAGLIFRLGVDTRPREFLAPYICDSVNY